MYRHAIQSLDWRAQLSTLDTICWADAGVGVGVGVCCSQHLLLPGTGRRRLFPDTLAVVRAQREELPSTDM